MKTSIINGSEVSRLSVAIHKDKPFDASSSHLLKGLAAIARVEHIGINDFECDPHALLQPLLAIKNELAIQA